MHCSRLSRFAPGFARATHTQEKGSGVDEWKRKHKKKEDCPQINYFQSFSVFFKNIFKREY